MKEKLKKALEEADKTREAQASEKYMLLEGHLFEKEEDLGIMKAKLEQAETSLTEKEERIGQLVGELEMAQAQHATLEQNSQQLKESLEALSR
jgi:chromosome segregation ATPase